MVKMKRPVTVIGDVVGSRTTDDRATLHGRLEAALTDANERFGADLRLTVGDEYQGTVTTLGTATRLTLHLRLALLPDADVRHGIGRGATRLLDPATRIEDGPGWWAARAAIDDVKARARRSVTRGARTAYRVADDVDEPTQALDAALLGRDVLVGDLDARDLSVLRALMSGRTQREVAATEGVSASAVSQRVRHGGVGTVLAINDLLEDLG